MDAYCRADVLVLGSAALAGPTYPSDRERVAADLGFHRTLVNLAGHDSLSRQYFALSNKFEWLYRWSENHWPSRIDLASWHRPIVDAVLSGDPDAAERAIREHGESSLADDLRDFAELRRQSA